MWCGAAAAICFSWLRIFALSCSAWARWPVALPSSSNCAYTSAELGRGRQHQDRDLERGQALDQPAGAGVHHDQVRLVGDDCLDVRLEPRQLCPGRLRRVVGVVVHRLDLAARADRVQHLGARRGQRDDRRRPRTDAHGPVGGLHGRGEAAGRTRRGRAGCAAGCLGTAARGTCCGENCCGCEGRQTAGTYPHGHPPSGRGGRSAPAATPGRVSNRAALPPRTARRRWPGVRAHPLPGHHRCGTAPESHRLRWVSTILAGARTTGTVRGRKPPRSARAGDTALTQPGPGRPVTTCCSTGRSLSYSGLAAHGTYGTEQ